MSIYAKCILATSCVFMVATFLVVISDPINMAVDPPSSSLSSYSNYFDPLSIPQLERRDVVLENRRILSGKQHRDVLEPNLRRQRRTVETIKNDQNMDQNSDNGSWNIQQVSEEISKRIAKDIASYLDMNEISNQIRNNVVSSPDSNQNKDQNINNKPVKVFILMGQSNMAGQGEINGDRDGSLLYAIEKKNMYRHLIEEGTTTNGNFTWATKEGVRYVFVDSETQSFNVKRNGWLSVETAQGPLKKIGPEIEIGWILGDQYPDEPILLLKVCTGNRGLGWDLLPPGSERFEVDGKVYAGYHDVEMSWNNTSQPDQPNNNITDLLLKSRKHWYGGKQYDLDVGNAKKALADIEKYYPGAKNGYEISGFFYWQGEKDRRTTVYADRYEQNLVRLIQSLRSEFDAGLAPFVVSSVGFDGHNMKGNTRKVFEAQMNVDGSRGLYPEFAGNVKSVDVRNIWRDRMGEIKQTEHYGYFGEAYMQAGSAMGWAMVQLMKQL